jgi:N-acetyl sugar amidotransferase
MDTTDPEIQFDKDGICNNCTQCLMKKDELRARRKLGGEYLNKIIGNIKADGKHKKYDAILGISGGIDSCYTAYLLKTLGVRTLLVHLDNGWNSNQANENIKTMAAKLNFDYYSYVLDWEEFRDVQLAFLKASVVEAETPTDVAIMGALHRVAAKFGVKHIISGGNEATEGILPRMWHYNAKDTKYFNYIQKTYGTKKLRKFPGFSFSTEFYFKFIRGIRITYLLNYTDYNKDEAMQFLQEQFDWKYYGGKHYESHFTKFIQSYLLPKKFNLDYRKASLSNQICSGQITREAALKELACPSYKEEDVEKQKLYISKKLKISLEELNEIIDLPGKYYHEYPNDEKRLDFIYKIYRKYFSNNMSTLAFKSIIYAELTAPCINIMSI